MGKITKHISSTAYIEKAFSYLKTHHGIRPVLVDKHGTAERLNGKPVCELPMTRFYPVEFETDVGGIRCSAESEAALDAADPHVRMCIEGLQEILNKELVLSQTADEMLRLSSQLHFLFNLAKRVSGRHRAKDYCAVVLREIAEALHADCAMASIQGAQPDKKILITNNIDESTAAQYGKDPVFQTIRKGTILVSLRDGTSALVASIQEQESPIGYMAFFKSAQKRFFTSYEKKFLGIIDDIISPTMESLRLNDSLHELYMNTVKALAAAIDAKDAYTHGHSFRVAKYAISIGRQLGVTEEKLNDLEVAAYMHDLGKIGVSEAILGKPGRLTAQEFEEVKKHPLITDKILEAIDFLPQDIVDAAVQHHERLDGRGYPLGLTGKSISEFARIIAVADVFDALTTTRFYRDAMTVEAALTILCEGIDTEYDRKVVLALVAALQKKQDQEMVRLYPELKFLDVNQMNQFLEHLTTLLLNGHSGAIPAA